MHFTGQYFEAQPVMGQYFVFQLAIAHFDLLMMDLDSQGKFQSHFDLEFQEGMQTIHLELIRLSYFGQAIADH